MSADSPVRVGAETERDLPNRKRTNPGHKCLIGFTAHCSCGWTSSTFFEGGNARQSALSEWRGHREQCERQAAGEAAP